jgi:signal transduction histidine kinase
MLSDIFTTTSFYAFSAFINMVVGIGVGFFIYTQDRKSPLNRTFFLFALAVAAWSTGYVFWQLSSDAASAIFYVRVLMIGAIFTAPAYLHFVLVLTGRKRRQRAIIYVIYIISCAFVFINFWPSLAPLFVNRVEPALFFAFWPKPGILYNLYLALWNACLIYAAYVLFACLRTVEDKMVRQQTMFVLWAMLVAFISGSTNYLLWYNIPIPPAGNILVSLYVLIIGYAVLKHHLFNAKVISTELLTFALWMFLLFRAFFSTSPSEQAINVGFLLGVVIIGVFLIRSVVKEVEQREKIQKLAEELQETNERQEELMHFIGHEVKGFLAKDAGAFASLAEGDSGELPGAVKSFVADALAQSRTAERSVMDLLTASNQKKGAVTYTKEPFDLKALAAEAVEKMKFAAERKGLTLSFTADEQSYQMLGDKAHIGDHVLRNLIDNAINYTPSGSIIVSLERTRDASSGKEKIIFAVKDTGIGISEEDKKRLFTEGGHGRDSQKTNVHSTGYGLYIAKSIIEAHDGAIRAESDGAGKGSTFIVEFPTVLERA